MSRTEYSDEFKAEAIATLKANEGNVTRTAAQLGMPASTLYNWRDGIGNKGTPTELGNEKKESLAGRLEEIAWTLAGHLDDPDKIQSAAISTIGTTFGIVIDKMRLLRDESTEITETRDESYRDKIRSRLDRLAPEQRN